jgi:hypothetical protein
MRVASRTVILLVMLTFPWEAFAAYRAVCAPMRTGPPKQPRAEWRGPCRAHIDQAERDAEEHKRAFPDHGARVMVVKDCGGGA